MVELILKPKIIMTYWWYGHIALYHTWGWGRGMVETDHLHKGGERNWKTL